MTATAVNYSNALSEAWQNFYDLVNSSSNVSDPTVGSGEFRKWVYSRHPDVKDVKFAGYPYIVLYPATYDGDSMGVLDGNSRLVSWALEIEVVSCDRGRNNMDGRGQSHCDTISNAIVKTLNNLTNRNTLRTNGLFDIRVKATDVVIESEADTLVYRRSIMVTARCRMKVSA